MSPLYRKGGGSQGPSPDFLARISRAACTLWASTGHSKASHKQAKMEVGINEPQQASIKTERMALQGLMDGGCWPHPGGAGGQLCPQELMLRREDWASRSVRGLGVRPSLWRPLPQGCLQPIESHGFHPFSLARASHWSHSRTWVCSMLPEFTMRRTGSSVGCRVGVYRKSQDALKTNAFSLPQQ